MKRLVALAIAGTVVLSLSACAPQNATVEDCVVNYVALGKDASISMEVCLNIYAKVTEGDMTQEDFNRMFLPE
jgi:hypothetical protein